MRILSKTIFSSLVLSLPLALAACDGGGGTSDGGAGAHGTGGDASGSGGDTSGSGGDTSGSGGDTSGSGGNTMFTVEQCNDASGPTSEVTGYTAAGAFVEGDWIDGWTNFSEDSTPEDDGSAPDETVDSDITTDTTWTADTIYSLDAVVYVQDGVTLTIEPGTLIKSTPAGSLVVSRGGTLDAQGTATDPIVFTSIADNGNKAKGDWGGVIILGNAQNWNEEELIEGLADDPANRHGGDDDADDSGTLKYVRIEFGGTELSPGNEINGLTLGSVGSGTSVSYIQVNTTLDDGIEWFGGSMDADHLVVSNPGDDMFDGDVGYRGSLSYLFGRHTAPLSSDPNGFEMDGDNEATDLAVAVNTTIDTVNTTLCGTGSAGLNPSFGAVFRENLQGSHDSMVVLGFDAAYDTRDSIGSEDDPDVTVTNSQIWSNPPGEEGEDDDDGGFVEADWYAAGQGNENLN